MGRIAGNLAARRGDILKNEVYVSRPVNATAARVVNQRGASDRMTLADERDCLVRRCKQLRADIEKAKQDGKNKNQMRPLTDNYNAINQQISGINKKLRSCRSVESIIIELCKKRIGETEYKKISNLAWEISRKEAEALRDD